MSGPVDDPDGPPAVDPVEVDFQESSADPRVSSVGLAHLSVELGHLYMADLADRRIRLREVFERVAPWASAARQSSTVGVAGKPRVSTCFLIDDYFAQSPSPAEVLPGLFSAATAAGVSIDYLAREAGCAEAAPGVRPAELVLARLVADPPPGTTGSRPSVHSSGWLCNGVRSPQQVQQPAMRAQPAWQPPSENGANRYSIFLDTELWSEQADGGRQWSCPFLSAVWQLLRLGLLREDGRPLWTPEVWSGDFPDRWELLPPVIQVTPGAAPFTAYRTCSVLDARFLPIEHAVRTVLSQFMPAAAVVEQLAQRAAVEHLTLPEELVDRVGYVFAGGQY